MAGDWIKLESATLVKPEVLRIAELLGISRRECLGLLFDFWVWLDQNCHADVTLMSRASLDSVTHMSGFAACLEAVGWAEFDPQTGTMHISNFYRHNGKSAKSRALANERQSRKRHASSVTKALPEKRREEKKEIKESTPAGFVKFWQTWPPSERKGSKTECLAVWRKRSLESRADEICAHVAAMKQSRKWSDPKFIEAPLVYLNQSRFDGAELPLAVPERLAI